MNQDFFESSVFWKHEQQMRKGATGMKDAKELKDIRKMMSAVNSQQNNYLVLKQNRKNPNAGKLKPVFGGKPAGHHTTFIFDNPVFEKHLSYYMEETQRDVSDVVSFEQFKTIVWDKGMPQFIIDFLIYISGWQSEVYTLIGAAAPLYNKIASAEFEASPNPLDLLDQEELLMAPKTKKPLSFVFGSSQTPFKKKNGALGVSKEDLENNYAQVAVKIKDLKQRMEP
jgi:hypothetical protein